MWKTFRVIWKMLGNPERWYWNEERSDHYLYYYFPESLDMNAYETRDKALKFIYLEGFLFGHFDVHQNSNVFIYPYWMRKLLGRRAKKMRRRAKKMRKNARKTKARNYVMNIRNNEYSRIMNSILGVNK